MFHSSETFSCNPYSGKTAHLLLKTTSQSALYLSGLEFYSYSSLNIPYVMTLLYSDTLSSLYSCSLLMNAHRRSNIFPFYSLLWPERWPNQGFASLEPTTLTITHHNNFQINANFIYKNELNCSNGIFFFRLVSTAFQKKCGQSISYSINLCKILFH